ncbi:uncharacterized protein DDB_G0290685-like [Topomyia yanbarensis]|uniref:uncharacterized protein DDB_G0290685-like n=1 Tax=Topomyia yanbarensis TaxID=2498891 RepID=UPI00273A912B|nr:uncharacterized protein DDB_G0290685-like [Topomyia yanbarensis]
MKLLIVLCFGTLALAAPAPAPQQKQPIDFLLDLNQDVLVSDREVKASVKPLSAAQVAASTGTASTSAPTGQEEDFIEQADVRESQGDSRTSVNQPDVDKNEYDEQEELSVENGQDSDERHTGPETGDTNEKVSKEDTTIRVYDEDENTNNEKDLQQYQDQAEQEKDIYQHNDRVIDSYQKEFDNSQTKESQQSVEPVIETNSGVGAINDAQDVQVQPDQLFNHGTLVFDRSTIAATGQEANLQTTTPFNVKNWHDDHGSGSGGWHPKFDFQDHEHGTHFHGMPPPWAHWHHHGDDHDHDHNHGHGHRGHNHDQNDYENQFHGHGFHRGGPWKWH